MKVKRNTHKLSSSFCLFPLRSILNPLPGSELQEADPERQSPGHLCSLAPSWDQPMRHTNRELESGKRGWGKHINFPLPHGSDKGHTPLWPPCVSGAPCQASSSCLLPFPLPACDGSQFPLLLVPGDFTIPRWFS